MKYLKNIIIAFFMTLVLFSSSMATVSSEDTPRVQYTANGITTNFPITFTYASVSDVHVYFISNTTGLATAWTKDASGSAGYTVSAGAIVANTAPSNGYLVAVCTTPVTQLVDVKPNRALTADTLEGVFDKLTLIGRDLKGSVSRALIYGPTYTGSIPYAEDLADEIQQDSVDASVAAVNALTFATSLHIDNIAALRLFPGGETTSIYLDCHTSQLDGGHGPWDWDADSSAVDNNGTIILPVGHVGNGRWIRQLNGFVTPEMFGDIYDVSADYLPINLSTLYSLPTDLTISKPVLGLIGNGWSKDSNVYTGSVLSGVGSLIINSPAVSFGFTLRDLAMEYTGTGSAITVDDVLTANISNINVDCNASGAIGINVTGDSYFAVIEKSIVQSFTDTGIMISTTGTKVVIRDPVVGAGTGSNANYGIEIRDEGVSIYDGQVNIERTDGKGIGIFFNNTSGGQIYGGLVVGTLSEKNTGIKIDGTTHAFSNVVIRNTRYTLGSGQKGIVFERAYNCTLENPSVYGPTGGTIATWGANSIKCGLIAGYDACRAGISVDVSATNAYKICTEPITYAQRASITVAANLTTTVNECQYFGKTTHNGTAWDKHFVAVANDAATSITPPKTIGSVKIQTTTGGGEYILANYNTTTGVTVSLSVGGGSEVSATDGTLTGTTGTDGYITLRSSSDGKIYIENRRGPSRSFYAIFE